MRSNKLLPQLPWIGFVGQDWQCLFSSELQALFFHSTDRSFLCDWPAKWSAASSAHVHSVLTHQASITNIVLLF